MRLLLPQLWQRRRFVMVALLPFSGLFYALLTLRQVAYRCGLLSVGKLPVPVIVVGNLVVGGSGKTPLVLWLCDALRAAGKNPGMISRGYGGSASRRGVVMSVDCDTPVSLAGDEPSLLATLTGQPLVVGRDRVAAAQFLLAQFPQCDVIISDDGLQHTRLPRQVEIVVRDRRAEGNGWLLPAGPWREPVRRLRTVDIVVYNGVAPSEAQHATPSPPTFLMQLAPQAAYQLNAPQQQRSLSSFIGQRILAFAGIAHPARFFDMLQTQGLVIDALALPDHDDFAQHPLMAHPAYAMAQIILMTEKDAVKCRALNGVQEDPRCWVVPVRATVTSLAHHATDADAFVNVLLGKLHGFTPT